MYQTLISYLEQYDQLINMFLIGWIFTLAKIFAVENFKHGNIFVWGVLLRSSILGNAKLSDKKVDPQRTPYHYLVDELCSTSLTSNLVWSSEILATIIFILKTIVRPLNKVHHLTNVMSTINNLLFQKIYIYISKKSILFAIPTVASNSLLFNENACSTGALLTVV